MAEPTTIDVGQTDDALRLWRATQAVRHGELRLTSQAINRNGLETRATSIIGWAVPTSLAAITAILNPSTAWITQPALAALTCFAVSAILACVALWPRVWSVVGYPPTDIMNGTEGSELEHQEQIAATYAVGIEENRRQLKLLSRLIRLAWLSLAVAPIAAGIVGAWTYVRPVLPALVTEIVGFSLPPFTS